MDNLTKDQRHKNMSHIRSKDTKIELTLRKLLWAKGYRYRKNYAALPGKPDIALTKYRIAIFCDSEFFHGKNWDEQKERLKRSNNGNYWVQKIQRNIDHDQEINQELTAMDWKVIRFWGNDIKKNPQECIKAIEEAITEQRINPAEYIDY